MIRFIFLLACASLIHFAFQEQLECKCWPGYEVTNDSIAETTDLRCLGVSWIAYNKRHYCNQPVRPHCKCTNATGIVTDENGTYCDFTKNGESQKKWDCENAEKWSTYKKNTEEFNKGRAVKV
ncbi:uncharacterized protein LOC123007847 [Tribolium madens]|uniref:uncharacterized protein LOC123007847 n=1 Tax=Tribolium madens TaxID=41895 RepID=UPI001CF72BE0|nr:uncharacterized protein LOC123007847 [Tribolium madens]